MGDRGPVPKRDAVSRNHNREASDTGGELELSEPLGPAAPEWLPPFAQWFYEQFRWSGQAIYYTPADWAVLTMTADMVGHLHKKPSAVMMASVLHACSGLGATEGDRRRIHIELARRAGGDPDEKHAVTQMDVYRNRLQQVP
jgi:hypothetical protein